MRKGSMAAWHAGRGASILSQLYELLGDESGEPEQASRLDRAISELSAWVELERAEVGTDGDRAESGEMLAPLKAWTEPMKAEPLDGSAADQWLAGRRPRRVLVIPFTGPLPGGKAGLDLDGEYFDGDTDLVGPFAALRRTRERAVDWHHEQDPTGVMKGAILGRVVLDERPEGDGLWADFWANAGEHRRSLIARLEERGVPLYGSSEAVPSAVRKASDGHIEVWPLVRHTITTSPQNTHAVVPALKALMATAPSLDALSVAALQAAMVADDPSTLRTLAGRPGERAGERKGRSASQDGPRARLAAAIDQLSEALSPRS